jgi:hypothetical protein
VTSRFIYEVNEGFGQTRRGPNAFRNAFSITLSGRMAVGGNPAMNNRAFGQTPGGFGGMGAMMMGGGRGGAEGRAMGGAAAGGLGQLMALFRDGSGNVNADSIMAVLLVNPVPQVLALRDTLQLTETQLSEIATIGDSLAARHDRRRGQMAPVIQQLSRELGGGQPNFQALGPLMQQFQLQVQPHMQGAQREAAEAMTAVQRVLQPAQWERLPESVRGGQRAGAEAGAAVDAVVGAAAAGQPRFNAVALLDRMLANPITVLLELRDTLALTADQVSRIEAVSARLQETLNQRRQELGGRFDNVQGQQQAQLFARIQPEIQRTREQVQAAMGEVRQILTPAQWEQVPEQIRDPAQPGQRRRPGGE